MNLISAVLMIAAGLFMVVGALTKSDFIVYRLLVHRSAVLFGEEGAYTFHFVSGSVIIILGSLAAVGYIW
jgi:hypothetical protein